MRAPDNLSLASELRAHEGPAIERTTGASFVSVPGTMRCTVADVDMVGYSDVARLLEENTSADTVGELNRQIQSLIETALGELPSPERTRLLAFTGDGALLLFESANDAHRFGVQLHTAAERYSQRRNVPSAKRRFRIGIATGEVNVFVGGTRGEQYAGITIANAVRLQAAAGPGELLIDVSTFTDLPSAVRQQYGAAEEVRGKRDEVFQAHRCPVNRKQGPAQHGKEVSGASMPIPQARFGLNARERKRAITAGVGALAIAAGALILVPRVARLNGVQRQVAGDDGNKARVDGHDVPSVPAAVPTAEQPGPGELPVANAPKKSAAPAKSNSAHNARQGSPKPEVEPERALDTHPPDPSEFDSPALAGTWEIASGDTGAAEVTLLELHLDGTYKKTLSANVKNPDGTSKTYVRTHEGRWRSRGTVVYLSGDGNSPEYLQDLHNARKLN